MNTTGRNAPTLAGNLASIITGGVVHAIFSFISPDDYDWESTRAISLVEDHHGEIDEKEYDPVALEHASYWILKWGGAFTSIIIFIWPVLALPAGVFSEGYFTFWAIIAILWGTIGSAVIILLPLYESWDVLYAVAVGIFTGNHLEAKIDEIDMKVTALLKTNDDAEKIYLLEKDRYVNHGAEELVQHTKELEFEEVEAKS